MHVLQASVPVLALYLPAGQLEQVPPSGPVKPALHVHDEAAVLPAVEWLSDGHAVQVDSDVALAAAEYLPAVHVLQASVPVLALYLPAGHAVQSPPSGPVKPALHVHDDAAVLPAGELESVGHAPLDPVPVPKTWLSTTLSWRYPAAS